MGSWLSTGYPPLSATTCVVHHIFSAHQAQTLQKSLFVDCFSRLIRASGRDNRRSLHAQKAFLPEALSGAQHGPDDPGELVGQSHRRQPRRLSSAQPLRPVGERTSPIVDRAQQRRRREHQQLAKISVALLGDRAELLLAAGRVLSWRQAKPRGKVASSFKLTRVGAQRP